MKYKHHRVVLAALLLSSILYPASLLLAQAPALINYQGRLLDGTNLVNGSVGLSLRLLDAETLGNMLYEDSNTVTVVDGLYSTFIGDNTTFGDLQSALETTNVWIEIAVNDSALSPRERLASVAYTLRSQQALVFTGAVVDAQLSANVARLNGTNQVFSGPVNFSSASNTFTGSFSGNGAAITNIGGASLVDGTVTAADIALDSVTADRLFLQPGILSMMLPPTNFTGFEDQDFGEAVAFAGTNLVLVGAPNARTDRGVVVVYTTEGELIRIITNQAASTKFKEEFGGAVAAVGTDRIVVGAPLFTTNVLPPGRAYLMDLNGQLLVTVSNPSPLERDEQFGSFIAGNADGFVIGAPRKGVAGMAFLYDTNGTLVTTYTNPAPVVDPLRGDDDFGGSVALIGTNLVAVGNPSHSISGTNFSTGVVCLFNRGGDLLMVITNPLPTPGGSFGRALATVGSDQFLVGAPGARVGTNGSAGRAFLYHASGTLLSVLTSPRPAQSEAIGISVAAVGVDRLLLGSRSYKVPGGGFSAPDGAVFVFSPDGKLQSMFEPPTNVLDRALGLSLAGNSGNLAVVGGIGDVPPFTVVGATGNAALLLDLSVRDFTPGLVAEAVAYDAVSSLEVADGSLRQQDIASNTFWNTTGNADTAPGTHFLGTTDGRPLLIKAGGVGIGTTNPAPAVPLHVSAGSPAGIGTFNTKVLIEDDDHAMLQFATPTNAFSGILFTQPDNILDASIRYNLNNRRELLIRVGNNATRMTILTNGFVGIGTTTPTNLLHVNGTVQATAYITTSDRNAKTDIAPVEPQEILAKVATLPISTWRFKDEPNGTHLGPMAQDFHAAFGLGNTDTGIMTVDADGVALAAIQALAKEKERLEEKVSGFSVQVSELEEENARLREELEAIKRKLGM